MAKNREGRDLLSDTPQGSDLKTYSTPNGEGQKKMSAFYLVNVFTRCKWALHFIGLFVDSCKLSLYVNED